MVYDVAVLGLGAMGAMAAWRAAARGARVLGVERFTPAHDRGSSHGGSRIYRETLFEGVGYLPLIGRAGPLWRALAEESGSTLFRRCGGLSIGPRDGALVRDALLAGAVGGVEQQLLGPDELAHRYPQHVSISGDVAVFEPGAGVLDPEASISAALGLAGAAGATLRFAARVTDLRRDDAGVRIEIGDETARARRVIVATGAWFTDLTGDLGLPLRVQRSSALHFTGTDRAAYGPRRFPVFVRESGESTEIAGWGIPDMDGTGVKLGAGPGEGKPWLAHADDNTRPIGRRDTAPAEEFCRLAFPGLRPEVVAGHPCMNSKTPDQHFVLGIPAAAPRLVLAGGFSGHGFKYAAGIGDILADLALDGGCRTPLDIFSPDRFAGP